jgi:large subunit ribosomal protein L23
MELTNVIQKAVLSEKSQRLEIKSVYTVVIHPHATKISVKDAFETLYGVTVEKVNIAKNREKFRQTRNGTHAKRGTVVKAYVTLKQGDKIAQFDAIVTPKK